MAFQSHLNVPSSGLLKPDQDLASILDPSYRTGSRQRQRGSSASSCTGVDGTASCPSTMHLPGIPASDASAHDPEFRPFMTPLTTSTGSSTTRPRITHISSSLYYGPPQSAPPSPGHLHPLRIGASSSAGGTVDIFVPPTKEQREAARQQLTPSLHAALEATEKRAARRRAHTHSNGGHGHKHRSRWLRRRAHSEPMSALEESPITATNAIPPIPPIPPQSRPQVPPTTDSGSTVATDDSAPGTPSDGSGDDDVALDSGYSYASHGFRQRVASISLKVDFALFRAKKRVKQTVGME